MFNLIKIAKELLVSNWDYFIGAFEKIDKNQLNNLMFNNNTQKLLNNIGFNLSNDDFIYLCCLYNTNFQESIKEQIKSGFLNKEYISNIKPNEFVLKYFQLLKKIILSKDFNFINKYIKELGFIYRIVNFAIYKIKFNNNKLTQEEFNKLDKIDKISLIISSFIKNEKDAFNEINNELNNLLSKASFLVEKKTYIRDKAKEIISYLKLKNKKNMTEIEILQQLNSLYKDIAVEADFILLLNRNTYYEYLFSTYKIDDIPEYIDELKNIQTNFEQCKEFIKTINFTDLKEIYEFKIPNNLIKNLSYHVQDIINLFNNDGSSYIEDNNYNIKLEDIIFYTLNNHDYLIDNAISFFN